MLITVTGNLHTLPKLYIDYGYNASCYNCGTEVILEKNEVDVTQARHPGSDKDAIYAAKVKCPTCKGELRLIKSRSFGTEPIYRIIDPDGEVKVYTHSAFKELEWVEGRDYSMERV